MAFQRIQKLPQVHAGVLNALTAFLQPGVICGRCIAQHAQLPHHAADHGLYVICALAGKVLQHPFYFGTGKGLRGHLSVQLQFLQGIGDGPIE